MFLRESRSYCIDKRNNSGHHHFFLNDLVIMLRFSHLHSLGFQVLLINGIDPQLATTFLASDKPWGSNHQFLGYPRFERKTEQQLDSCFLIEREREMIVYFL